MSRKLTDADKAFRAGYLMAVANVCHLHDEPVVARDVLAELGIGVGCIRGLDLTEYDLSALRPLFREIERRKSL